VDTLTTTYTPPADYIAASQARTAPRFAETRRLQAAWQEAYYTWQALGTPTAKLAMQQAHEAYKQEQARAFSTAYDAQRQSTGFQQRAA
jgi:hypothetical protein